MSSLGDCIPPGGTELVHEFGEQTTQPGQEVLDVCRSWTLNNETELFISTVHLKQNEGSHHSNFVYVPDTMFNGPDGFWSCPARGYEFYFATTKGGVLYAQSTQATDETQKFPKGAVIRIPPHSRIISDVHLLNTKDVSTTGHATMSLVSVPAELATTRLRPFHVEYADLHIAPYSSARFTSTCDVATGLTAGTGKPYVPHLYYTLPHTHGWGKRVFARIHGGPNDGAKIFDVSALNGESHGKSYDPPIDLTGSLGFTFGCEYQNDGPTEISFGFGGGEMCEIFGFIDADLPFFWAGAGFGHGKFEGTDGSVQLFGAGCVLNIGGSQ